MIPTTDALDKAVAELVAQCAPYVRIGEALTAIRRLQDHATLNQLGRVPSVTRPLGESVKVLPFPYHRLTAECHHDDDDGGRAA